MGLVAVVAIFAIVGYALTSEKRSGPTLKQHAHASGFVIVVCLLALIVFLVALASVHVPGQ